MNKPRYQKNLSGLAISAWVLALACLAPSFVLAAPGDLDTTFGGGAGWVSTPITRPGSDQARSVIRQVDGKLVAAGVSYNGSNDDFALVRYNSNGTLDTTFSGDGKLTSAVGASDDHAYSVIQQADGKLVVAGSSSNGNNYDFALVRYNSDGTLDTTFSGDGKLTTAIGASTDEANAVIQQVDGKLVVAGSSHSGSNNDFALVRYNSNGTLDTTFSGDGKLTTAIGVSDDVATSVIQQTDGRLVVAGITYNGSNLDFALVRYNSDGTLDATFSGDGKLTTAIGVLADVAYSVIQQTDGKLVAAGYSDNGSTDDFALVRYNSDGTLDTTFSGDGKLTTAIGASADRAYSVIQQANGKLVAAGYSIVGGNADIALVRINSNGALDTSFNNGTGKLITAIGESDDIVYSVIQQADGKLVAAGYSGNGSNWDFALLRVNSDGALDTTFDTDGKLLTNIAETSASQARSVIQQADGKLVVAGYSYNGSNYDFALVRYNGDGTLDASFNGTGKLTTAIGALGDQATSVIQQLDGKLVAAGYSYNGSNDDFTLVRYNSNGSLDTTFNGTGKLTTAIGALGDQATSVIQQLDGKLVVAGYSYNGSNDDFALVRYNSNGSLDTTFNGTGKLITAVGASADQSFSVIQQADGKLVVAGSSYNGSNWDFALVRYNSDGSLDTTLDTDGKLTTDFGASNDFAYSLIQQADGKLAVAGYSDGSNSDFALVRYNSNGTLDATFNGTGKLTTAIGTLNDVAQSIIQQADDKLVVAGYSFNGSNDDVALVRYNSNGTLDTKFNSTGKRTVAFGASDDFAYSVIQQANGKLAVAGYSSGLPTGQEFVVARFESGQPDTDNDGVLDISDAFPNNPAEWLDADNDGTGNNADFDDDGDGVPDVVDAAPLNPAVTSETSLPMNGSYKGSSVDEAITVQ